MASPPISGTFNFYPFFFFSFFGKIIRVFWFIAIPPIVLNIQIYRFDRLVWLCYMEEEGEERFFGLLHPGEKKKKRKTEICYNCFFLFICVEGRCVGISWLLVCIRGT